MFGKRLQNKLVYWIGLVNKIMCINLFKKFCLFCILMYRGKVSIFFYFIFKINSNVIVFLNLSVIKGKKVYLKIVNYFVKVI